MHPIEILLIDDDPLDVELATQTLTDLGLNLRVSHFPNGLAALAFLQSDVTLAGIRGSARPTFIFLDLNMPLYDGLMVLDQLKDDLRTRRIPVFILTGNQDDHHFLESYRLGATSYITKPLTAQKFRAALKEAGLTWMLKARGPVKAATPAKAPAPREHREPRARAAISR